MRNSLLTSIIFLIMILSAILTPLDADTGFYLGVVNSVYEGMVPYQDFTLSYPPAFIVMLLPIRAIAWSSRAYAVLAILTCVVWLLACAIVFSRIVLRVTRDRNMAGWSVVVFLLIASCLEGINVYLEPFACLFGLLAIYFVLGLRSSWVLLSGVMLSLALMSKQYGLLFVPAVGMYVLVAASTWRRRLSCCYWLSIGFLLGALLSLLLLRLSGVDLEVAFTKLQGGGYGTKTAPAFLHGLLMLVVYLPFLPLALYGAFRRPRRWPILALAGTGLFFSLFQLIFRSYAHYLILTMPFAILIMVLALMNIDEPWRHWLRAFVVWGYVVATTIILSIRVWHPRSQSDYFEHMQTNLERMVGPEVPDSLLVDNPKSKVFCFSLSAIPYYIDRRIGPTDHGFGFGDASNLPEKNLQRLLDADFLLVDTTDLRMLCEDEAFANELLNFDSIPSEGDVLIFERKR